MQVRSDANLSQLDAEIAAVLPLGRHDPDAPFDPAAGLQFSGLLLTDGELTVQVTRDGETAEQMEMDAALTAAVEQVVAAHVPAPDLDDEELRAALADPGTTDLERALIRRLLGIARG